MKQSKRDILETLKVKKYIITPVDDGPRCNICQGPFTTTFLERTEDGKDRIATERISCLGHEGILPHLWVFSDSYARFEEHSLAKLRMQLGRSPNTNQ